MRLESVSKSPIYTHFSESLSGEKVVGFIVYSLGLMGHHLDLKLALKSLMMHEKEMVFIFFYRDVNKEKK